jgi:hypothetical protein
MKAMELLKEKLMEVHNDIVDACNSGLSCDIAVHKDIDLAANRSSEIEALTGVLFDLIQQMPGQETARAEPLGKLSCND